MNIAVNPCAFNNELSHNPKHIALREATLKAAVANFDECSDPYTQQVEVTHAVAGTGMVDLCGMNGSFTLSVTEHPDLPGLVYKVCRADPMADPYILYAQWVYENRLWEKNPHFPRIFEINYTQDGTIALLVMEKLEHLSLTDSPDYIINDYWGFRVHIQYRGTHPDVRPSWYPPHYVVQNTLRPIKTAAHMIHDEFDHLPFVRFDLHAGNFMLRGEVLVCIDPLSLEFLP